MNSHRLWTGFAFIAAGVLFLLNTLGLLQWDIWWRLIQLWPVLLISIGLSMVFGRSRLAILGPLLMLAVIAFAVLSPGYLVPELTGGITKTFVEAFDPEVKAGRLTVEAGAGRVYISGGEDLIAAELDYTGLTPSWDYSVNGSTAVARISSRGKSNRVYLPGFRNEIRAYSGVRLNTSIPWTLDFELGAGDLEANLRSVRVSSLTLNVGAGKVDLRLGDSGAKSTLDVDSGVGKVDISVPDHVGLRIKVSGGINSSNVSEIGLERHGDYWMSPNWDTAASSYDINLSNGIGRVDITRYTGTDRL